MKKWLYSILFLSSLSCMLAPWKNIRKARDFKTIIGYDLLDKDTYKGSIACCNSTVKKKKQVKTISSIGSTSKQIRPKPLEQQTSHDITSGQLRTILFDKNISGNDRNFIFF